ncbi:hypothetical protein VTJ49DRAFT_924 [Mycothermus thermophilus]|uniref:NmrA-like domain-containing protein n=1 Tax=Humicola insolens TaxID=85995 RepID=A0ABR3VE70_HUMIN
MTTDKKLIVVLGATGNQGGSVARRFIQDPRYRVRAVTRDTSSPKVQELAKLGIELAQADFEDVESLKVVFAGANVIFSNTQYWEAFFRPDCRTDAAAKGISCREYAYIVERRQSKNIADAAATVVDTLDDNGFLVSTLSHAGKSSGGRFKDLYHFDGKAEIFPDYVNETYPKLAAKMSCIYTGFFTTSHRILPGAYFRKHEDGTFEMRFPCKPTTRVPHLDVNHDTGPFVYAVSQMPPGKAYMASSGEYRSFPEWIGAWGKLTGNPARYTEVEIEDMQNEAYDEMLGLEVAIMLRYCDDPGYDGGMELLKAEDLRKAGIDCPMLTLEESLARQDWTAVINKPVWNAPGVAKGA